MNFSGKWTASLFLFIFLIIIQGYSESDSWLRRGTYETAKKAYSSLKEAYQNNKNYETAWKFARMAQYYGDFYIGGDKKEERKKLYTESKAAAEAAVKLNPDGVEGHYYLSMSLGSWAEANGVLKSLFTVDDILKECTRSIEIDPSFEKGGGYMIRGRVYQMAPGAPLSKGDLKKAEEDYKKALEYGPDNRTAHHFYAELLAGTKRMDEAKKIIYEGFMIPYDPVNKPSEDNELFMLVGLKIYADTAK